MRRVFFEELGFL